MFAVVIGGDAILRDLVEEGHERVVVFLLERVVFVVVTAVAGHGEAEPCGGGCVDTVEEADIALFFGDCAAFTIEHVVAVETGGDEVVLGWVWKEVASELLDGELIERHVVVEGFDDPVSPNILVGVAVHLEAVAVGVTGSVEPG